MITRDTLQAFDLYLIKKDLTFDGVIIGGAALILLGLIERATQDVDCLDPTLPESIKRASIEFAKSSGSGLKEDLFNNGPESLKHDLSPTWKADLQTLYEGTSLRLYTLGRLDLLRSKLYAYCDRQQDLQDCLALKPSLEELQEIRPWLIERDANPLWPDHVEASLSYLAKELGHVYEAQR